MGQDRDFKKFTINLSAISRDQFADAQMRRPATVAQGIGNRAACPKATAGIVWCGS